MRSGTLEKSTKKTGEKDTKEIRNIRGCIKKQGKRSVHGDPEQGRKAKKTWKMEHQRDPEQ